MNNFRKVLKNTSVLLVSEVIHKGLGFFWTIFLARSLGVDLFGRYSLVNAFVALFAFLPDFGVGLIFIRDVAKNKKRVEEYLGNSLMLNSLLAVVTSIVIIALSFVLGYSNELIFLIALAATTLFVSTIRSVGIFFFDGTEKMEYSAFFNVLNVVALYVFGGLLYLRYETLAALFAGMLIGTVFSLAATWAFILRKHVVPKLVYNFKLIKHLLVDGFPLALASFAAIFYSNIDTVILAQMKGDYAVGIYNVATPFSFGLIGLLNVPFVVALFPTLSRLSEESKKRFEGAIIKSLGVIALWSFPAAILISKFAFLIPYIFGEKYAPAVPVLSIHIFMVPFACLTALLYKVLIVIEKQYVYLVISLLGAGINLIVVYLLIPPFGVFGAAYSAIITQAVIFVIYSVVVYRFLTHKK